MEYRRIAAMVKHLSILIILSHVCRICMFSFFFSISSVRDKAFVVALKPYSQLQWWNGGCTNCHSWLDVERFRNCVQSDRNTRHIKLFTLPSIFSKNGIFRNRIFVVSAYMRCTIVKRKIRLKLMCIQKEFVWWFGMDMTGFLVQLTHYRTINRLTSMETTEKSPHTHVKCLTLFQSSANAYFIKKKREQPWILLQHPLPPPLLQSPYPNRWMEGMAETRKSRTMPTNLWWFRTSSLFVLFSSSSRSNFSVLQLLGICTAHHRAGKYKEIYQNWIRNAESIAE